MPRQQRGAEAVEHGLAGVQPDDVGPVRGAVDREPAVGAGGVDLHGAEHRVEAAPALRGELENAVGVAIDPEIDQRCRGGHEPPDVAGQQPAIPFPVDGRPQLGQAALDVAAPEQRPLAFVERAHLLGRQQAVDAGDGRGRPLVGRRLLQVVFERDVLEQAAHDVEDLVRPEFGADRLELVEQRLQHPALARFAGDEVDDDHRVVPLAVAVDAAHALFEARGVPGHVVVHHQPAELQVDALARGVGGDQVVGAALVGRAPEQVDLRLAPAVVEAAVNRRHLSGEAEPLEAADQELGGVAVLGEHDELLAGERGVAQHAAELLELRVFAVLGETPRPGEEGLDLAALLPELREGRRDDAAERAVLERLVALAAARLVGVLVRRPGLEEVGRRGEPALAALQLVPPPGAHQVDRLVEPVEAALERPHQGVGRAGQPPLEDAHRQPRRRAVQDARAVVDLADVARRRRVEGLLGRAQPVAEGVAPPLRIQGAAVEADHLFLRPPDEVPPALGLGERPERVERRQRVGGEQAPEAVVGEVLPHVRRRRQQQEVGGRPAEVPPRPVGRQARQRLGEAVAVGLVDGEVLTPVGGQLVRLVEDHEVVRRRPRRGGVAQPSERALAGQRVDADDHPVALRPRERVAAARVVAPDDAERQREERPQLALPVADEPGRRHDQDPPDEAAGEDLPQVQAGHDRLARAGVVGQQEAERRQAEHALVDGDALVRQGVDQRDLGREGGVEEVAVRQPRRLGDGRDDGRPGGEVELRPRGRAGRRLRFAAARRQLGLQVEDLPPRQPAGPVLAVLPAVHGGERHPDARRELRLRQPEPLADGPDAGGVVRGEGGGGALHRWHRRGTLPVCYGMQYSICYFSLDFRRPAACRAAGTAMEVPA